jgi:hypothetical protein
MPKRPEIELPVIFRPDLLPDGKPRWIQPGEMIDSVPVGGRGLLICASAAQLADLMAFVNSGPRGPFAQTRMTRGSRRRF